MGRSRNPNRDKAFSIYKENNGNISIDEISNILNEDIKRIKIWKSTDKWDIAIGLKSNKRGAPKKNKNAKGNKGGSGAKKENQYARKMGWYSKYQPRRVCKIVDEIEANNISQLEIMWVEVKMQWALIIDNLKQLHVSSKNDHTKVLKKESYTEFGDTKEYEVITAYEKQLKYTKEMSNARKVLFELIEKYIAAVNKDWDLASEEHKLRVEMLRGKINNNEDSKEDKIDKYLNAIHKEVNNDN